MCFPSCSTQDTQCPLDHPSRKRTKNLSRSPASNFYQSFIIFKKRHLKLSENRNWSNFWNIVIFHWEIQNQSCAEVVGCICSHFNLWLATIPLGYLACWLLQNSFDIWRTPSTVHYPVIASISETVSHPAIFKSWEFAAILSRRLMR